MICFLIDENLSPDLAAVLVAIRTRLPELDLVNTVIEVDEQGSVTHYSLPEAP